VRSENHDGDAVGACLGSDEVAGCRDRIVELPPVHRAGAIDGDDHALLRGQVVRSQVDHPLAVFGQRRRLARGDWRDEGCSDRGIPGRIDTAQADARARRDRSQEGDDGGGEQAADQHPPAHSNPP
jgi:hypothetical protein